MKTMRPTQIQRMLCGPLENNRMRFEIQTNNKTQYLSDEYAEVYMYIQRVDEVVCLELTHSVPDPSKPGSEGIRRSA